MSIQLDDIIDSRDVIARIEELEGIEEPDSLEAEELESLKKLAADSESSPDWNYGESLIKDEYFTSYIEELINDCYELPKAFDSGEWPWRHMTLDYDAAAAEAKADYFDVYYLGHCYWIRG
jgi:hypothetical protein